MKASWLLLFLTLVLPLPVAAQQQGSVDSRCTNGNEVACIDWENGVAIAIGSGAPASWANTAAQKNLSARRAAKLDAARNLLELIKGVNLTTSTTMRQAMIENDQVQSQVEGRLHSLRPVGQPKYFSDGSVQVRMEASLYQVVPDNLYIENGAVEPREIPPPDGGMVRGGSSAGGVNPDQVYSGLIIDARGTGVTPALSPKVYDPEGREVYGSAYVSREFAVSQGMAGYVKDMERARNADRVQGNPAVVKAVRSDGNNNADLVISQADADALRAAAQKQTFLREARVMIVLD